jgi:multisubunit Na+/H+ antiporter MnhF subunit
MMGKVLAVLILLLIVGSLFTALYRLTQKQNSSDAVVKALTLRVGLSIGLFIALFANAYFGLVPLRG